MTRWRVIGRLIAGSLTIALAVRLVIASVGGGLAAALVATILGAR